MGVGRGHVTSELGAAGLDKFFEICPCFALVIGDRHDLL